MRDTGSKMGEDCRESCILHPVSRIPYPASCIPHLASRILHPAFRIHCPGAIFLSPRVPRTWTLSPSLHRRRTWI